MGKNRLMGLSRKIAKWLLGMGAGNERQGGIGVALGVACGYIIFVGVENSLLCCCKILVREIKERSLVLALPTRIYLPTPLGPLLSLSTSW